MKVEFLTDLKALRSRFEDLVKKAHEVEIAVAWAGKPDTGVQPALWKAKAKVTKLVVGCAFHHTHPDFLKRWQGQSEFRVVQDVGEIFHPKVYLFRSPKSVCLLLGSSNLTAGGFEDNFEANILLTAQSETGSIAEARAYIDEQHKRGTRPQGPEWASWFAGYRSRWKTRVAFDKKMRGELATSPGGKKKAAQTEGLGQWSFAEYFQRLKKGNPDGDLQDWLKLLEYVRSRWAAVGWWLGKLPPKERQILAGAGSHPINPALFGPIGLGYFKQAAITVPAPTKIDQALRCIPRAGPVKESHWTAFTKRYSNAFQGAAVGSASRLLCFWRPDIFFSANEGSVPEIARHFQCSQTALKRWEGYWQAVKWVGMRPWARSEKPEGGLAERCWRGRVALLDVLMYRA